MTVSGITWNTVMAQYRALKAQGLSGLEARLRGPHWHLLGSRCRECGFLTMPNRFYIKGHDAKEVIQRSQAEAEAAYLEVYPETRTETRTEPKLVHQTRTKGQTRTSSSAETRTSRKD